MAAGMIDPGYVPDETPPPQPPRPTAQLTQSEAADFKLALSLHQEEQRRAQYHGYESRTRGGPQSRQRGESDQEWNERQDREHSFFEGMLNLAPF
jgi:hypothetical protein